MKNFSHLIPLFATKDGKPFVYWDPKLLRLLIFHGKRLTIIVYDETDRLSCPVKFTRFQSSGNAEQIVYGNGRPVASYSPVLRMIIIKRDGNVYSFDANQRPLGYASGMLFDEPEKTFPGLQMVV